MKLENVIYLDSSIKVFFLKTERKELETISPKLVQNITIGYSIGLINNLGGKVQEFIKIDRKDIEFLKNYVVISFHIENLHDSNDCEISFHLLIISLKNFSRFKMNIDKTYTFKSIQSQDFPTSNLIENQKISRIVKIPKSLENQKIMSSNSGPINLKAMRKVKREDHKEISNHFIDSYKKFKADIQDTDLLELLRHKTSTIDFNLKNFGISLLCKLLLLVKYVNELVDNDFQSDLQEFLHINIFKNMKKEVPA